MNSNTEIVVIVLSFLSGIFSISYLATLLPSSCPPNTSNGTRSCFLAAVYEHHRIGDQDLPYNATWAADQNLLMYERVTEVASKKGAVIIVLPEASLYQASNHTEPSRSIISSVAEEIPDPNSQDLSIKEINPCLQRMDYEHKSPKITRLSCLAKKQNIYVVCNLSEKQSCLKNDSKCPEDGHYNYNTDVVFDNHGNLVARYRKFRIFNEESFHNVPEQPERIVIDTPFGRLGIFTCFDIVFASPALDIVLKDQAQTVLFPSRWYDELPFFSAIQAQSAWSYTMNVNVLAANGHLPILGTVGSGLFAGRRGPILYTGVKLESNNNDEPDLGSHLILANMPVDPRSPDSVCDASNNGIIYVGQQFEGESNQQKATANLVYNHMNMEYNIGSVDKDIILEKKEDDKTICIGGFCCRAVYKINDTSYDQKFDSKGRKNLILFTRNHVRPGKYRWYEQSCFLATIEESTKMTQKREFSTTSHFKFDHLRLEADFDTRFVFEASAKNISTLVKNQYKDFRCSQSAIEDSRMADGENEKNRCVLKIKDYLEELTTAGLYGRIYKRDET